MCLPSKLSASLGSLGPLVLVTRVTNALTLTDPTNLRSTVMDVSSCCFVCVCFVFLCVYVCKKVRARASPG